MSIRSTVRDPASLSAALLLAAGFGAAAAFFTLVNALMYRPLPFPEPERLVAARVLGPSWSPAMFEAIGRETSVFAAWAGIQERAATVLGARRPEIVRLESVSAAYFELLGARPEAGRVFTADEDRWGGPPAALAVVRGGLAIRRFGASAAAVGKPIEVEGRRLTIVGVLPESFRGAVGRTQIWVPLSATRWLDGSDGQPERPESRWFEVIGRLAGNASLEAARSRYDAEVRRGLLAVPNAAAFLGDPRPTLVPLAETRSTSRLTAAALILLAGAGLVVLMAAINLAGLHLARSAARHREFAIRLALGQTRGRIALGLARDAGLVVAAGAIGALAVRGLLVGLLAGADPGTLAFGLAIADPFTPAALALDGRVAAVLAVCAVASWAVIVAGPSAAIARMTIEPVLRRGHAVAGARSRLRGPSGFVAAELAIATVLVIGAGLMTRSAMALAARDRGFDANGVVTARIDLPPAGYDLAETRSFMADLVRRAAAVPGVQAAGVASCVPGGGRCRRSSVRRVDGVELPARARPTVGVHFVTPGLFGLMGATIAAGRDFDARETAGSTPVAVVSRALEARLWPGGSGIGRRLSLFFADGRFAEDREVVGVVRSIEYDAVETTPPGDVYLPAAQAAWSGVLFVRVSGAAAGLDDALADAAASIDRRVALHDVAPLTRHIRAGLSTERFVTRTLVAFAVVSLALASFGAYALVRVSLARRTRELAIRAAMGASRARLLRETVIVALLPATLGVGAGLGVSAVLVQTIASLLHGVPPHDPVVFVGAPAVLIGAAAAACLGPAWRAGRTDPRGALSAG